MADAVLVVGAALAAGVAIAHSYLGERYILRPILSAELPPMPAGRKFSARTMRFAWHLTSVAWVGLGAVLLVVGDPSDTLAAVSVVFAVSSVITAGVSRGRHLAWPVFGAIAVLAWLGR